GPGGTPENGLNGRPPSRVPTPTAPAATDALCVPCPVVSRGESSSLLATWPAPNASTNQSGATTLVVQKLAPAAPVRHPPRKPAGRGSTAVSGAKAGLRGHRPESTEPMTTPAPARSAPPTASHEPPSPASPRN